MIGQIKKGCKAPPILPAPPASSPAPPPRPAPPTDPDLAKVQLAAELRSARRQRRASQALMWPRNGVLVPLTDQEVEDFLEQTRRSCSRILSEATELAESLLAGGAS